PLECENLVHEAVVVVFQELETYFRVAMQIGLVVERVATPHDIRPVHQRAGRAEAGESSFQEPHAAHISSGHDGAGVRQTISGDLLLLETIGLYNYHAG